MATITVFPHEKSSFDFDETKDIVVTQDTFLILNEPSLNSLTVLDFGHGRIFQHYSSGHVLLFKDTNWVLVSKENALLLYIWNSTLTKTNNQTIT
jgi:hypothetical protein